MALLVALDCGVPGGVVARASQLKRELQRRKGQQQQGTTGACSDPSRAMLPEDEGHYAAHDGGEAAATSTEKEQEAEAGPAGVAAGEGDGEPEARAKTLQDAMEVLRQLLTHLAEEGGLQEDGEAGRGVAALPSGVPELHVLKPEQKPPASHQQRSVVYVIR